MIRRSAVLALVPALATLFGCASAGASAGGAVEPGARADVVVAVLPAAWATEAPAADASSAELARTLERAPSVRAVWGGHVDSALASEPEGCVSDVACVRRVGQRTRAAHVVTVELAELGGTVLVRASVVDVADGTRASTRQEVVQRADSARIEAAVRRLGRAIATSWAPPAAPPAEETRWYESTGLWGTVAGVAVAAAAVTAIVLVTSGDGQEPDGTITPP